MAILILLALVAAAALAHLYVRRRLRGNAAHPSVFYRQVAWLIAIDDARGAA